MKIDYIVVIGLIAGTCTTISLLPQVIKTIRTKETKDISLSMYIILSIGLFLWIFYGALINALPIILANTFSLILAVIILILKMKYG
jgi:MtN3 and saliva related transmembrane protein